MDLIKTQLTRIMLKRNAKTLLEAAEKNQSRRLPIDQQDTIHELTTHAQIPLSILDDESTDIDLNNVPIEERARLKALKAKVDSLDPNKTGSAEFKKLAAMGNSLKLDKFGNIVGRTKDTKGPGSSAGVNAESKFLRKTGDSSDEMKPDQTIDPRAPTPPSPKISTDSLQVNAAGLTKMKECALKAEATSQTSRPGSPTILDALLGERFGKLSKTIELLAGCVEENTVAIKGLANSIQGVTGATSQVLKGQETTQGVVREVRQNVTDSLSKHADMMVAALGQVNQAVENIGTSSGATLNQVVASVQGLKQFIASFDAHLAEILSATTKTYQSAFAPPVLPGPTMAETHEVVSGPTPPAQLTGKTLLAERLAHICSVKNMTDIDVFTFVPGYAKAREEGDDMAAAEAIQRYLDEEKRRH